MQIKRLTYYTNIFIVKKMAKVVLLSFTLSMIPKAQSAEHITFTNGALSRTVSIKNINDYAFTG